MPDVLPFSPGYDPHLEALRAALESDAGYILLVQPFDLDSAFFPNPNAAMCLNFHMSAVNEVEVDELPVCAIAVERTPIRPWSSLRRTAAQIRNSSWRNLKLSTVEMSVRVEIVVQTEGLLFSPQRDPTFPWRAATFTRSYS